MLGSLVKSGVSGFGFGGGLALVDSVTGRFKSTVSSVTDSERSTSSDAKTPHVPQDCPVDGAQTQSMKDCEGCRFDLISCSIMMKEK
jgi:hypothetical protein